MSAAKRNEANTARDAKRARFAGETPRRQGASPAVLAAGLLLAAGLIAGALLIIPRLSSAAAGTAASGAQAGAAVPNDGQAKAAAPAAGEAAAVQPVAATQGHEPYPLVTAQNGAITLPASTFDDGKAHFYTYMSGGEALEFFVLKSQDGVIRAAFNACDVCFAAGLGYHQEGDEMVCNNCGSRFPSNRINEVRGGCNPSPLDRTVVGGSVSILENDLTQGFRFFGN